ncbi:ubiquitin-conjugating enzyme E2 [Perkinsela sp. CCAP 1560/4]|nr:ubiquitin-conjugating enzyme E2 [Perkinsela sp. CCAP 1560/4]|eukprot:KNH06985.1 ubiquitin-conjugating enzyme E2 [Perkinsela sp. CCAP 1560/4]
MEQIAVSKSIHPSKNGYKLLFLLICYTGCSIYESSKTVVGQPPSFYCTDEVDDVTLPIKGSPDRKNKHLFSKYMSKDSRLSEKHKRKFKEDTKKAIKSSITVESSSLKAPRWSCGVKRGLFNDEGEIYSSGDSVDEELSNSEYSSPGAAIEDEIEGEQPTTETEVVDRYVDILDAETLQPIAWPSLKTAEKNKKRESHRSKAFVRRSMMLQSDSSDRNNTNYVYSTIPQFERRVDPLQISIVNDRNPFFTLLFGPRRVCVPSPVLLKFELHLSSHFGRTVRKNPFEGISLENWKDIVSELYWFGHDKKIQQRESRRKLEADSVKSFQSHWMTRLFTGALHKYIALVQRTVVMGKCNCDVIKYQWFHRGSCIFIESDLNGKQLINTKELTKGLVPEFAFDDDNNGFPEISRRELNNFLHLYSQIAKWESTQGDSDLVQAMSHRPIPFQHELDYIWGPNYWFDAYLPRDIYEQSLYLSNSEQQGTTAESSKSGLFSGKEIFSPILVNIDDENENSISQPTLLWCPSHDNASILSSTESFRTDYSENSPFSAEEIEHFRQSMEQNMVSLENSCEKSQPLKYAVYNEKCFTVTPFSREVINDHIVGTPASSPRVRRSKKSLKNTTLSEDADMHYVLYPVTGRVEDEDGFFTVRYFPPTRITMFYGKQDNLKGFTPQEGDLVKCLNAVNMIRRVARNSVLSSILENPHFVREGVCLVGINDHNTYYR